MSVTVYLRVIDDESIRRLADTHEDIGEVLFQSSHSFSAMMIVAQGSANRLQRPRNKTTDGRVLPAKFGPSRVVRPSRRSRLVALGTTA